MLSDKRNKNIYLDNEEIDGTYHIFDLVNNVNKLCNEFDLKIVICSTWRLDFNLNKLKLFFRVMGFTHEPIGVTTTKNLDKDYMERFLYDNSTPNLTRSMQIDEYLKKYRRIKNYIILDDLETTGINHENNFYKVDPLIGFDDNALQEARELCKNVFTN